MKADLRFVAQPKEFWAYVRTISQEVGYTERGNKSTGVLSSIKIPTLEDVRREFGKLGLDTAKIANKNDSLTDFGQRLFDYFSFRATVLNDTVQGYFMNKDSAAIEFKRLRRH